MEAQKPKSCLGCVFACIEGHGRASTAEKNGSAWPRCDVLGARRDGVLVGEARSLKIRQFGQGDRAWTGHRLDGGMLRLSASKPTDGA
jgi:hypothetical protein